MKQPDAAKTLRIRVYGLSECRPAPSTIPARFGIDCRSRAGIQIRRRSLRLNEHFWQLAFGATALNKKILALLALAAFGVKQKPPRSET
jgi:hypothetical protein